MKMNRWKDIHIFKNENEMRKLYRSLAIYNKNAYYQLVVPERFRELEWELIEDNKHKAYLQTDILFEKVYGKCYVVAEIRDNNYRIIDIQPKGLLLDGYRRILQTYRGIPYRDKEDLDKLKVMEKLIYGETKR